MKPETVSTRDIYSGRIFDVRVDTLRHGEDQYDREVVVHRGSAVIVPLYDDGTVALVKQYRHAARETLLEVPAGSLENGEAPETCAARELEEEVGVTAARLEKIAEFYVSPGFLTEKMFVYLATGLTETQQNLEIDEDIDIHRIPLAEAIQMAQNGTIQDAKTIIALTTCQNRER